MSLCIMLNAQSIDLMTEFNKQLLNKEFGKTIRVS